MRCFFSRSKFGFGVPAGEGRPGRREGPPEEWLVRLGADSWRRGRLTREPAPLPRTDAVVRVAWHECDCRRLDHAVVLADHAALAAFMVLNHDRPLEHRPHAYLFPVDDRIETAADLVVEGWDDAGQRNQINDLVHMRASLPLG